LNSRQTNKLKELFLQWCGHEADHLESFPKSGSNRQYFRLSGNNKTAIGVIGENNEENIAFINFTKHFRKQDLKVPAIFSEDLEEGIYLLEDLGDRSLFSLLKNWEKKVPTEIEDLYKRSLQELIKFQILGHEDLDYSVCFPCSEFDEQSIQWDLNYFKYYYLKPAGIDFNEQKLEDDFQTLIKYLLEADSDYFMFRDFQSRNIQVIENEPWFIDYQGGRKGPLQYDIASLLFQAKANLPYPFREQMLNFYIKEAKQYINVDEEKFREFYYGFVLIRTLQVMGAYGYRGFFEQKPHFIESAKFAIQNLDWLLNYTELPIDMPELYACLKKLIKENIKKPHPDFLTVEINSFSYKKTGIPKDTSGHGGGFVFDCRSLPNPGRHINYKVKTGLDKEVIDYFKDKMEMGTFVSQTVAIADQAVSNYLDRKFDHLMFSFGCTGGQHRSVYTAQKLFDYLRNKYQIRVSINHREQNITDSNFENK